MTIKKNLVVTNGTYISNGEEKKRYVRIGALHKGDDGHFITLDAHINLAAFPRKEGSDRIIVSLYDPKERDNESRQSAPQPEEFDDDIPF